MSCDKKPCCDAINNAFGTGMFQASVIAEAGRIELEKNYMGAELIERSADLALSQANLTTTFITGLQTLLAKIQPCPNALCCSSAALAMRDLFLAAVQGSFTLGASLGVPTASLPTLFAGINTSLQQNINLVLNTVVCPPTPCSFKVKCRC